jgi:primary-amine oxidase
VRIPNAICIHEEDTGILWKHTDFRTGEGEVRRGRRLVISSIASIGNYDYGFFWYLHQDGRISSEVKATGIVSTRAVRDGADSPYGKLVAPSLDAPHHQHIFCVRLDLDVDGANNTVYEVHCETVPRGPDNPHGNAWVTVSTPLRSESEAKRVIDPLSSRSWIIANPQRLNQVGQPTGFRLIPGENALPFVAPDSVLRRRAGFVEYHLWVTPYRPEERYPAGAYPYQHRGGAGLPEWTTANRRIENADVVVWYTMNHTHVPRPEDWPVMPVAAVGFELKPTGFFDRNPTLDIPPPSHADGPNTAINEKALSADHLD